MALFNLEGIISGPRGVQDSDCGGRAMGVYCKLLLRRNLGHFGMRKTPSIRGNVA
jgi:hypothetical protein